MSPSVSTPKPCVLVVEDEPAQQEVLRYNLVSEGCDVVLAETGDDALIILHEAKPDLVLLDWMLPNVSGIEICRQIKARNEWKTIPVIMISARSEEVDLVRGLETGADDYVTKPFSTRELMARVRTHLRKSHPISVQQSVSYNGISIDADSMITRRDGAEINLGPVEFRLLSTLLSRPNRVWTRELLLETVWNKDTDLETRTVDVHIARLRKALCKDNKTNPIRTIRGVGYSLIAQPGTQTDGIHQ